jgi:hypothetical protein
MSVEVLYCNLRGDEFVLLKKKKELPYTKHHTPHTVYYR